MKRLVETRNRRTGEERFFINGKRVSNHDYSKAWLKLSSVERRPFSKLYKVATGLESTIFIGMR